MVRRKLIESDILEVVRVHQMAFSDFFLSQLGKRFLRLYYKSLLKDPDGFGFGIFDDAGNLLGFSAATTYSKGFNRNLIIKNFVSFFFKGMQLVFSKPKSLFRLIMNLSKNHSILDDGNYAELFSIAVDPEIQGRGFGDFLLSDIENFASLKGCKRIALTTDFFNNTAVINFYLKRGYTFFYDFTSYPNRRMYKMIKILS